MRSIEIVLGKIIDILYTSGDDQGGVIFDEMTRLSAFHCRAPQIQPKAADLLAEKSDGDPLTRWV